MNKYLLLVSLFLVSVFSIAQHNKYLAGAVPEVGGKVVFEKSIAVKQPINDDRFFSLMDKWAQDNYKSDGGLNSRVLLSDPQSRTIACGGEKYLVFKKSALVLDQAKMTYQMVLEVGSGKCNVTVRNIRYDYSDSKELQPAEQMITDKIALNKKGDKLNKYYDKFRVQTIDSVNSIFRSIDIYLNGVSTTGAAAQQVVSVVEQPVATSVSAEQKQVDLPKSEIVPASPVQQAQSIAGVAEAGVMPGYKRIAPDKIPGNYIKLLSDWTLITSGTADQMNVMTASWGGIGSFWEKPVVFCFLNPTRYSVKTMDKGDTYTISFYTEAYKDNLKYCGSVSGSTTDKIKGSGLTPITTPSCATAFSEAWMIFECKKIVSQQLSSDAVVDKSLPSEWSKNGYHKMYIGEIVNVWVK